MVWEQRVRRIAWICFALMWVPLAFVVFAAVTETEEPPVPALVLLFSFCILFAILLFGSFVVGSREKERIKKTGIPAKATILSVSETGTRINDQPLVRIGLEVQPPYESRFTTTVEYVLSYAVLPQIRPGDKVPVYYIEGTTEVALADL
ncbi:MAG: hypothetical protein LUO98_06990 [Methanoregula sp.]|nr:hypothetical protein [Methanoregula sp.]